MGTFVVILVSLAGCVSPTSSPATSSEKIDFAVDHIEESERTIATIGLLSGKASWKDVTILWNGKAYAFGPAASLAERWFQVAGRKDASDRIENGDKVSLPAAGLGTVKFVESLTGRTITMYDAMIPDNRRPATPLLMEPTNGATGVTLTPAWRWGDVLDPSGTSYTLEWSIDPLFTIPMSASKTRLTTPMWSAEPGDKLGEGQTYYWRVAAADGAGNVGAWSEVWSFTTAGA